MTIFNTIQVDALGNIIGELPAVEDNTADLPSINTAEQPAGSVRSPVRSALSQFISEVKIRGMARNNRYLVEIPLNGEGSQIAALFCESVSLPGLSVATTPQRIYGEQHEIPYERMFDPVTFTFYVDSGMIIKKAFDDWMSQIINPLTRAQAYYKDYIRNITIKVYNVDDSVPYMVTLKEAYPKSIQAVQLDANGKDIMRLTVTIVYKYWESAEIAADVQQELTDIIDSGEMQDPFGVFTEEAYPSEDYFNGVDAMGNQTGF